MKVLLANCSKFQEWTGAADAAAALGYIYTDPVFLIKDYPKKNMYAVIVDGIIELDGGPIGLGSGSYDSTTSTYVNLIGTYPDLSPENSALFRTAIDEILEQIFDLQSNGFKTISFFKKMNDIQYMWSLSNGDDTAKHSDKKKGFQMAFEEGQTIE